MMRYSSLDAMVGQLQKSGITVCPLVDCGKAIEFAPRGCSNRHQRTALAGRQIQCCK